MSEKASVEPEKSAEESPLKEEKGEVQLEVEPEKLEVVEEDNELLESEKQSTKRKRSPSETAVEDGKAEELLEPEKKKPLSEESSAKVGLSEPVDVLKTEEKETKPELEKPKFVFGLTTSFLSTPAFSLFLDKKKTVDGADDKKSSDSSTVATSESKPVFGGNSTFGNAFQMAMNKKSIFDQPAEKSEKAEGKDTESEPKESTPSKDPVYQQIHLEKKSISTGEEGEKTVFGVKAKLYSLDLTNVSEGWKEKGVGIIRLNRSSDDKYRLLMRADAILKVILNVPVTKGFEIYKGMESSINGEKFLRFNHVESENPIQYALRFGQAENTSKLYELIKEIS